MFLINVHPQLFMLQYYNKSTNWTSLSPSMEHEDKAYRSELFIAT